ncbi:hypothetical protein PFTANZ_05864, partial [Plasmodium falciparum Tanzania (2000708)]
IKFEEFQKQKDKYQGELQKLEHKSSGDNNCCTEIKKKNSAAQFLKALKHCKDDQSDRKEDNDDKKNNKIDFSEPLKTFSPTTYCKACPVYGVTCNSGGRGRRTCTNIDESKYRKGKSINGQNDTNPKEIKILVLGRKGKDNNNDKKLEEVNNACNNTGLFKDYSLQKWNCRKMKGIDQCNLTNFSENIDFDQEMQFNEFIQRWLRNFVQDYNKLKDKIKPCINKEDGIEKTCIEGCNNKCDCVEKWLDKKSTEWDEIKSLYKQYSKISDQEIAFRVKSYFREQLHFDNQATKAQEVVETPCEKQQLWGCTGKNLENIDPENCEKGDFITNLIDKLKKKATSCKDKHSDQTHQTSCDSPPLVEDEDDTLHDEIEVKAPKICPPVEEKKEQKDEEEKCDEKEEEEEKEEEKDKGDEEEGAAGGPAEPPSTPPSPRPPLPPPADEPFDSTILQTTIPFGVALALGSIAFLFLK